MKNYIPFNLDHTPSIIYIQNKPDGIGQLYIDGKRITGLIDIEIKAETKRDTVTPQMKLKVKRVKKDEYDNTIIPIGFENSIMEETYELER